MKIRSTLLAVFAILTLVMACSKAKNNNPGPALPIVTPEFYTFKGDTAHVDIHHNGYTGTYDTITAYCDTCNASTLGGSSTLYILFGDSVRIGSYAITSNIYPSAGQVQLYLNTSSGNPYSSIGTGTITVSLTSAGKKNVIGYGIQMIGTDTSVLSLNITP